MGEHKLLVNDRFRRSPCLIILHFISNLLQDTAWFFNYHLVFCLDHLQLYISKDLTLILTFTESAWIPFVVPHHRGLLVSISSDLLLSRLAFILSFDGLSKVLAMELYPGTTLPVHLCLLLLIGPAFLTVAT